MNPVRLYTIAGHAYATAPAPHGRVEVVPLTITEAAEAAADGWPDHRITTHPDDTPTQAERRRTRTHIAILTAAADQLDNTLIPPPDPNGLLEALDTALTHRDDPGSGVALAAWHPTDRRWTVAIIDQPNAATIAAVADGLTHAAVLDLARLHLQALARLEATP